MSLLRMQNRTPPIYCEESRDFQLLCRLYDTIVNGMLFDIETITDLINTKNIRSSFLQLLQTKLGFFTLHSFDENTLRYTLNGFPQMVKYKGSKKSIEYAVNTFLKINNILSPVTVTFQKEPLTLANGYTVPDHTIVVGISASLQESTILEEIFRYILPIGVAYYFYYYSTTSELTSMFEDDNAVILYISGNINSVLRTTEKTGDFMDAGFIEKGTNEQNRLIGAIDTVNLITNTFGELGDLIYTDGINNSFAPGNNLQFLGVHYGNGAQTLESYLTEHFSGLTPTNSRTIIVYNEKEYLYESNTWNYMKLLPADTTLPTENVDPYSVIYYIVEDSEQEDISNEKYYIYKNSNWVTCEYPIYVIDQAPVEEDNN